MARLRGEDLAILLLDFKKAYDRVDWVFLEGTMLCMGFSAPWVRGVAALYTSAHSQVLMAGGCGERFALKTLCTSGMTTGSYLVSFLCGGHEQLSCLSRGWASGVASPHS